LTVGSVAVLAGLLFTLNAKVSSRSDLRDAPGLRGMVTARDRQVEELAARNAVLAAEVADLVARAGVSGAEPDRANAIAAGAVDVAGPGLTVTLDDAKSEADILADPAATPSDRLVHQQDIDAVMNALWAGGAEAMSVQGHRVGSTTEIKCVGNVILVAGRVYAPPYAIAVIGPAEAMRDSLAADPLVTAYRQRAARLALTWSVTGADELVLPADIASASRLRYAQVSKQSTEGSAR
jgi:uncharacterized protein YlxW (UPF0749 family)